jgi:hypothetical protein
MSTKPKGLYVNQELWLQVKIKSPQLGLTMSAFTEQAIKDALQKHSRPANNGNLHSSLDEACKKEIQD